MKKNKEKISFYVAFNIGRKQFATNVCEVITVIDNASIIRKKRSKNSIVGHLVYQEKFYPVFDVRRKFVRENGAIKNTSLILVRIKKGKDFLHLALKVNSIEEVYQIKNKEVTPVYNNSAERLYFYSKGQIGIDNNYTNILDFTKLFTISEINEIKMSQIYLS